MNRSEEIENKILDNTAEILKLAGNIEMGLVLYEERRNALPDIKELLFVLRETANLIAEEELDNGRNRPQIQTSEMMPCQMCNDYYPVASEYVRGIRWEPVPGKGQVYICWECVIGLSEVINRQLKGLSCTFLFSLSKETETQRNKLLKEIEEAK